MADLKKPETTTTVVTTRVTRVYLNHDDLISMILTAYPMFEEYDLHFKEGFEVELRKTEENTE